jgi:hypothetical protein
MKRLVLKKLFTEDNAYIGARVNFYYMHIREHDELYFFREIKQAFKIFGFKIHIPIELTAFLVPTDFVALMSSLQDLSDEEFSKVDLKASMADLMLAFDKAYESIFNQVNKIGSDEGTDDFLLHLFHSNKVTKAQTRAWDEDELKLVTTFTDSGYVPMYFVEEGSSAKYYLARVLDTRIDLIFAEVINFRGKRVLQSVNQFYVTREFMNKFLTEFN